MLFETGLGTCMDVKIVVSEPVKGEVEAASAPVMTALTDGVGTANWSGTVTRSLESGIWFYPYAGTAISVPDVESKRFDWGEFV